jgi:DNA-binding MarR family transcriptional regulator
VSDDGIDNYRLEEQVGFILREVSQRHSSIFSDQMLPDLTPTRFAALAKLYEKGPLTQNELGRQIAMDAASIKGVVGKLTDLGLVAVSDDTSDRRRRRVQLTDVGRQTTRTAIPLARDITRETLDRLTVSERAQLLRLLGKMR